MGFFVLVFCIGFLLFECNLMVILPSIFFKAEDWKHILIFFLLKINEELDFSL